MEDILLGFFLLASTLLLSAQEKKLRIAVFDPAISGNSFDEGTGVIIREMVSTAIVNSGKYIIIERSLIDRVLKEQKFSNSGAVDDRQISQIGKLAGANKVILSVLSSSGNRGLLSLKMIDVESANIESQKAQVVELSKILDIITPLALEVIGEQPTALNTTQENTKKPLITSKHQTNSDSKQVEERINDEERVYVNPPPVIPTGDDRIVLFFPGYSSYNTNPTAQIYIDDVHVGTGALYQGFTLFYKDNRPGKHKIKIKWSEFTSTDKYTINTQKKKYYTFQYVQLGYGFCLEIKKT